MSTIDGGHAAGRQLEGMTMATVADVLAMVDTLSDWLGPDAAEFREEVAAAAGAPSEPGSLARQIAIIQRVSRLEVGILHGNWRMARERAAARAAREAELARTYEIQVWGGKAFKKPERLPKEAIETPWRAGCVIVAEAARIDGRGFDSDVGPRFALHTHPIGHDLEAGTVVGKRLVRAEDGMRVQYLAKPRAKKAQAAYEARRRLAEVEYQLGPNADYHSPENIAALQAEAAQLRAVLA
jgi:hypothetical protein